jgi:MurNAc alpha-1-phosphate uridylyltransferase
MKINSALILCAGFGKRLSPLTLKVPKPLLEVNNITILERCINIIIKLGINEILINTFHLSDQILEFIETKKFSTNIKIIKDGNLILDTGGGILNMMNNSKENNFIVFNPDTLWSEDYIEDINQMQNFYFSKKLKNILLLTNKKLSFDKNLSGDFQLKDNLLKKEDNNDFIYIGCQILSRDLFKKYDVKSFSISEIWKELLKKNKLNGYESSKNFYHLTNLDTFKKLKDL